MPGREFRCYHNLLGLYDAAEGLQPPEVAEYAEIFWIYRFALTGKGLGFCLPHLAALEIFSADPEVVAVPLKELEWHVCFTWLKNRALTACEQDYMRHITRQTRRLLKEANKKMGLSSFAAL